MVILKKSRTFFMVNIAAFGQNYNYPSASDVAWFPIQSNADEYG